MTDKEEKKYKNITMEVKITISGKKDYTDEKLAGYEKKVECANFAQDPMLIDNMIKGMAKAAYSEVSSQLALSKVEDAEAPEDVEWKGATT